MADERIDVTLNLLSDAGGRDPDAHSKALRRYHRQLWSKNLPDGRPFQLDENLHHQSDLGGWSLASDAITNSYKSWGRPAWFVDVREQMPQSDIQDMFDAGCTVGAYIVFPYAKPVHGRYPGTAARSGDSS